ncbi:hypothetical protein DFJ74DRAFT_688858 [Hyaloraphidium curvatum]|nr:hypothetical protein DFJ74DRAFT_688858 [Hyaloraphidium curvatum]
MPSPFILVTGCSGRLGGQIAQKLVKAGKSVVGTDRVDLPDVLADLKSSPQFKFVKADLVDAAAVDAMMAGASAVVHVGAIPGPSKFPPPMVDPSWAAKAPIILEDLQPGDLLQQNLMGTFNIFNSAVKYKVSRVVFSSTAFAMGWSHDPMTFYPKYLPLDEEHPPMPCETYGLSKALGEQVADMFVRSSPDTSFASLRFTNIIKREKWADLPAKPPSAAAPVTLLMLAYTHEDDVLDVHLSALTADIKGHESFLIAAPDTRFTEATTDVLASTYPGRTFNFKTKLVGNQSIISAAKAAKMLGFKPRSWAAAKI